MARQREAAMRRALNVSHPDLKDSPNLGSGNETLDFAQLAIMASASISKIHLTKTNTSTRMTVGCGNPFKVGDKPQSKAVFFCLLFFGFLKFREANIIMAALRWRPSRSVAPTCGITTRFNAVTNTVVSISDGYPTQKVGIHQ